MTRRRNLKRRIRERMARTGESYSTARAVFVGRAHIGLGLSREQTGVDTGLGIVVRDIEAILDRIVEHGGCLADGVSPNDSCVIAHDPDGNVIQLQNGGKH